MAFHCGPRQKSIVTDGLVLSLDAGNTNSYPGAGTTWSDLSGNGNNGTLTNGPTFNSANQGSIVFDGTNDYITTPDSTSLRPTSFSIDTWFKPTSFGVYNNIVAKPVNGPAWSSPYLSYMVRISANGTLLECSTSTGGTYRALNVSYTFLVNTIYNISFTFDSSTGAAITYLNGSILSSTTHTAGAISYASAPVLIGANYGGIPVGEFFAGNIYNVQIYNKILSQIEITQNYEALRTRF
jgi:hypothetical protein